MRSFIGWIGGKSHLKNQIIPLIPNDCDRYIEVCGGAGWVLFGKDKIKGQMVWIEKSIIKAKKHLADE